MEKRRCFGCMQQKQKTICEYCGYDERRKNAAHHLQIGTILNEQYVIGRVLGQSHIDIQYLAWDSSLNSPVTIREFFPKNLVTRGENQDVWIAQDAAGVHESFVYEKKHFVNEIKAIAQYSFLAEIASVKNRFQENGTEYVVTEYVQGVSLRDHVSKRGVLSIEDTCVVLQPIMKALSQMHAIGVIHQNINPDNIILLPKGGVKLLDFGFPRNLELAGKKGEPYVGAPSGFAPVEQYQHSYVPGSSGDIYSLCATIYFCLTGKIPPDALSRKKNNQKVDWRPLKKKIHAHQMSAIRTGMDLLPQNRQKTVVQLYQELLGYSIAPELEQDPDATIIVSKDVNTDDFQAQVNPVLWKELWKAPPKHFSIVLVLLSLLLVFAAGAAAFYFTYHIWTEPDCTSASICRICKEKGESSSLGHDWRDATCTCPKTCERCSLTFGEALGHTWQDATCEEARLCITCGEKDGSPYGHDWKEASYTEPQKCNRCGLVEGNIKGYIGKVNGKWSDERFYYEDTSTNIYELEKTIENCKQFALSVGVSNIQFGSIYGDWAIFGRNSYGGWDELASFELTEDEMDITCEFTTPITFDAVAVFPYEKYFGNYGKRISLSDVQVYID